MKQLITYDGVSLTVYRAVLRLEGTLIERSDVDV